MSNTAVSTLAISFGDDDDDNDDPGDGSGGSDGSNRIVLEQTTRRPDYFGDLYARVNPSRGLSFKASKGSVTPTETYSWETQANVVFSGSSRGQLPVSGVSGVGITPIFVLTRQQRRHGGSRLVRDSGVKFRYDYELDSIIAEKDGGNDDGENDGENDEENGDGENGDGENGDGENGDGENGGSVKKAEEVNVWGVVSVNYSVSWLYLKYTPGRIRYSFGRGYEIHIGTIYAYNDFAVASLDMEIDLPDKLDDEEYCRVTSEIVLTRDGPYELPTNWREGGDRDAEGVFSGVFGGNSTKIDPDNCFIDERAHLIMNVDAWGRTTTESHHQRTLSPYQLTFGYKPEYHLKFSPPPDGPTNADEYMKQFEVGNSELNWQKVFLSVNKAKIISDLEKRFPGLIVEG